MKLTGENRSTRGKTCPSATLSTTYPTWNDPGSNPGLRGERAATDRLSHGTTTGGTYVDQVCKVTMWFVTTQRDRRSADQVDCKIGVLTR
jgi:hypothetical protein